MRVALEDIVSIVASGPGPGLELESAADSVFMNNK